MRLYVYDTLLQRLPQDLQDMAAELGVFIQKEHTIVGQRHVARRASCLMRGIRLRHLLHRILDYGWYFVCRKASLVQ